MITPLDDPRALLGRWSVEREVEDRYAGEHHRLDGWLTISADSEERLRWAEALTWRLATGPVEGERLLFVVRREEGWEVVFADDRPFHAWDPGEQVVHPCAPDTYRGTVTGTLERWTVVWEVSGPSKDYTMTTVLTPAAGTTSSRP